MGATDSSTSGSTGSVQCTGDACPSTSGSTSQ
jgi:hypothetical protein